jgi:hypothetical protein
MPSEFARTVEGVLPFLASCLRMCWVNEKAEMDFLVMSSPLYLLDGRDHLVEIDEALLAEGPSMPRSCGFLRRAGHVWQRGWCVGRWRTYVRASRRLGC